MTKMLVRWEEGPQVIEQDIFKQLLQRLHLDAEGKIFNFTLNSDTGIVDITFKLGFKSAKEIATVIKRNINALPEDMHNRNAMARTMSAEWRGYKDVSNRFLRVRKENEAK